MSWSYSQWHNPTNECTPAMHRGKRIHALMERVMAGTRPLEDLKNVIRGYDALHQALWELKDSFQYHSGGIEDEIAVDDFWCCCDFEDYDAWCRCVIDLWIRNYCGERSALLVEFKTGYVDVETHIQQVQLSSAVLAESYDLEIITPRIIYLDAGKVFPRKETQYNHTDFANFRDIWEERACD